MLASIEKTNGRIAPTFIKRLAFGVRFEPQFSHLDKIGTLIDSILKSEGTPFGPESFPLSQSSPGEQVLLHPNENRVLHITNQDAILQWPVGTYDLNAVAELAADFQKFVIKPLRKIGQVRGLTRYGVLFHMDEISSFRDRPVNHYLSKEFPGTNSLSMRFTRRLPSEEALVKKDVEDYRNVIYTIVDPAEGKVNISIDYQEYFKPALDSGVWDDKPFPRFVNGSLGYFEGEFRKWFEGLVGMTEVA